MLSEARVARWNHHLSRAISIFSVSTYLALPAFAQREAAIGDQPLRPGDLSQPIFVSNSTNWQPRDLLFMRLQGTLEPGKLELRGFYRDGIWNRNLAKPTGIAVGGSGISGKETLWVNPSNGYVFLGNQVVGGIYRLANLNIVAVYFIAPIAIDAQNDVVVIGQVDSR